MLVDQTLLLTQFMTLLAVLDPISHTTLFLSVTDQLDKAGRRRVALIAIPLAFAVLVIFAVVGQFILEAMNISLISFQIAGGIIMFLFALLMVLGQTTKGVSGCPRRNAREPGRLSGCRSDHCRTGRHAGDGDSHRQQSPELRRAG